MESRGVTTTARADVVSHLRTVLLARQTTSPERLRAVYNARPGAFPETPCAYIGPRDEEIAIDAQTKTRRFTGLTVILVDTISDAAETEDRMDVLVDLLVGDFLASRNLAGGGGRLYIASVADSDIVLTAPNGNDITYRGAILGFRESNVMEGLEASQ